MKEEMVQDSKLATKLVREDIANLEKISEDLRNDKDFIMKLFKDSYVINQSQKDRYIILKYIGNKLKKDKKFAMSFLKPNNKLSYKSLHYFDKTLLNDEDVILQAIKCEYDGVTDVYELIEENLKHNKEFWLKLIEHKPVYYSKLDDNLKNDFDFNYKVLSTNNDVLKYMNEKFRCNSKFITILKDTFESKKAYYTEKFDGLYRDLVINDYFYSFQKNISVTKRDNNQIYYKVKDAYVKNKIIINKDLLKFLSSDGLSLDFSLLENSNRAKECNERIYDVSFKEYDKVCIITFGADTRNLNYDNCFTYIIKKIFDEFKNSIEWYYMTDFINYTDVDISRVSYPFASVEIIHLFYNKGFVYDEYLLNNQCFDYEKRIINDEFIIDNFKMI